MHVGCGGSKSRAADILLSPVFTGKNINIQSSLNCTFSGWVGELFPEKWDL